MTRYRYRSYGYRAPSRVSGRSVAAVAVAGVVLYGATSAGHARAGHLIPASMASAPAAAADIPGCAAAAGKLSSGRIVTTGLDMAAARGWTGCQAKCLNWLWTRESGWRRVWNYGGSGAYGIPQALPASKMASAGADYMTNPVTEIRWGLGYIKGRYGSPCGAWGHETDKGWY